MKAPLARSAVSAAVHHSSTTDEWSTPQDFFDKCNAEFGPLELDPCATTDNAKCPRYFARRQDGLLQKWAPARVWMNPPYGRGIGEWMRKAFEESTIGALVVCLVPARTDTAWWHDYAMRGKIRYIRGRLKFGGHENFAPFPSALVVFCPQAPAIACKQAPTPGKGEQPISPHRPSARLARACARIAARRRPEFLQQRCKAVPIACPAPSAWLGKAVFA